MNAMNANGRPPRYQEREYLTTDQYLNPDNLDARARLHRRYSTNKQGWAAWIRSFLPNTAESNILDCGSGPGYFWQDTAISALECQNILLMDLSVGMVRSASARLSKHQNIVAFVVGDAADIPFADKSFEVVMANHMLYHVPDRTKAIAELERVLKPGGWLLATTNGAKHLQELAAVGTMLLPDLDHPAEQISETFSLENGEDQLGAVFRDVTQHIYENRLLATDVEDVVAYVLSSSDARTSLKPAALEETRMYLKALIEAEGAFRITVDSGIFVAKRAGSLFS